MGVGEGEGTYGMKGKQGGEKPLPPLGFMDTSSKAVADNSNLGELQWVSWDLRNDAPPSDSSKRWSARYTMRSHLDAVTCVAFHPTEHMLVSGSEDRTLKIWNLQQQTRRWAKILGCVHCHTISPPFTVTPSPTLHCHTISPPFTVTLSPTLHCHTPSPTLHCHTVSHPSLSHCLSTLHCHTILSTLHCHTILSTLHTISPPFTVTPSLHPSLSHRLPPFTVTHRLPTLTPTYLSLMS